MAIKVRPVVPFPSGHNTNPRYSARKGSTVPEDANRAWLILGKPVEPSPSWKCGTDVVWEVLQVEGIPGFELLEKSYVCRHQIKAGD